MANIFNVAKYILDTIGGSVSTMRLQKLCYYSQAWALVWNNKTPLFCQEFQAWQNGPVNRELFDLHKGKFAISSEEITNDRLDGNLSEQQTVFIDKIIGFYGKKPAAWLSELTHQEKPWQEAREKCGAKDGDSCVGVITQESMYNYYSNL